MSLSVTEPECRTKFVTLTGVLKTKLGLASACDSCKVSVLTLLIVYKEDGWAALIVKLLF